ncbi:ApeI family dehydratase [Micromonospora sp. KLBMP9576]|uniref:ApeI family dehydratase n=1 Tax=Micromonospora sp. KLBMP9576 TaxID=3424769 RepID=UPI003D8E6EA1
MNALTTADYATAAPVDVEHVAPDTVVARVRPDPDDPVFAGHYPGFPLLPGVHIFEFVHRAVRAVAPELVLDEIVSCRFLLPFRGEDELVVTIHRTDELWRGEVAVAAVPVAEVLLRYRSEE